MSVSLVTGGSGGIGLAIARELRKIGDEVILVARDPSRLQSASAELGAEAVPADLGSAEGLSIVADLLRTRRVDRLVNNAGFGHFGEFADSRLEEQIGMIRLNVEAQTALTHAALPAMIERGSGQILNISSVAGFMPGPLMAVYYATKAYVNSFSEALADELHGSGVTITCACPGATETNFAHRADMAASRLFQAKTTTPEYVAAQEVEAMLAGRRTVVIGRNNQISTLVARLLPTAASARLARRAQERA